MGDSLSLFLVDGGWGEWGDWSSCSLTCGTGSHSRHRRCDTPTPEHGGIECAGIDLKTQSCLIVECPGMLDSIFFNQQFLLLKLFRVDIIDYLNGRNSLLEISPVNDCFKA